MVDFPLIEIFFFLQSCDEMLLKSQYNFDASKMLSFHIFSTRSKICFKNEHRYAFQLY